MSLEEPLPISAAEMIVHRLGQAREAEAVARAATDDASTRAIARLDERAKAAARIVAERAKGGTHKPKQTVSHRGAYIAGVQAGEELELGEGAGGLSAPARQLRAGGV